MVRSPTVAGMFYESDADLLSKQIAKCFTSKFGPGDLPTKRKEKRIYGVVSPHAGYNFSGPCAAWAYKEIAESKFPETFVILGPDHSGYGDYINASTKNWETPFGMVFNNTHLVRGVIGKCNFVNENEEAHKNEHSVEVQLPFLQFSNKDKIDKLKIAPFSVTRYDYEMCKKLGKQIASADEDIVAIASSDFTHYGRNYGYIPFINNVKEEIHKLDNEAIQLVCKLKTEEFLEYLKKKKATVCGGGPIAIVMETVKGLGAKKGKLLHYYTSGDIINNYNNSVGYASIVFV